MQELKVHLVHEVLKEREDLPDHPVNPEQKGQKAKLELTVGPEELVHSDLQEHQVIEEHQDYQDLRDLWVVEELKVPKESVAIQERQEKKGPTGHLA